MMLEPADVNDRQSRLNPTRVAHVVQVQSVEDLREGLRLAARRGLPVAVCGGRHSMGGQQFATDGVLLDMSGFNTALDLDTHQGRVTAGTGILWPELMRELEARQNGGVGRDAWGIRQKQTGVDEVSLGGSLSCNAHGRGLRMPPLVEDIEAFTLMNAAGDVVTCSRTENPELFALAIGGYGCFGVVLTVTLRLARRQTVRRNVRAIAVVELIDHARRELDAGAIYGDCQYATHLEDPAGEHPGIFSCYHPDDGEPDPADPGLALSAEQWEGLIRLARTDKPRAFDLYRQHYLKTDGRRYASDRHQLSPVFAGYLAATRAPDGDAAPIATEMITEVYCDPDRLMDLLTACRADFVEHGVDMTYGTIRLIEPDGETFLPWARRRSACIVVNLHVKHDPAEVDRVKGHFRRILDRVIERDGSFYLTYHRWAERRHLDAAYPQMPEFIAMKRRHDPAERFASDWYRHLVSLYPEARR